MKLWRSCAPICPPTNSHIPAKWKVFGKLYLSSFSTWVVLGTPEQPKRCLQLTWSYFITKTSLGSLVFSPQGTTAAVHTITSVLRFKEPLLSRNGVVDMSQSHRWCCDYVQVLGNPWFRTLTGVAAFTGVLAVEGRNLPICMKTGSEQGRRCQKSNQGNMKTPSKRQKQLVPAQQGRALSAVAMVHMWGWCLLCCRAPSGLLRIPSASCILFRQLLALPTPEADLSEMATREPL